VLGQGDSMRVLIVEDDQFYSQRISELLQDREIEATIVRSAEEAVQIDMIPFDAEVIDVMLPNDPSALSALKAAKANLPSVTGAISMTVAYPIRKRVSCSPTTSIRCAQN
jgi:DNA-binding response OmpR family regulator